MQAVNELVWKHMLPALEDSPLPENNMDSALLSEKLHNLSLRVPEGSSEPERGSRPWGRTFVFPENTRGLRTLGINPRSEGTLLTLTNGDGVHPIKCGNSFWQAGRTGFEPPSLVNLGVEHDGSDTPCAACGAWTAEGVFSARLCYTESPMIEDLTLHFESNQVTLSQRPNLSLVQWSPKPRPELIGLAS